LGWIYWRNRKSYLAEFGLGVSSLRVLGVYVVSGYVPGLKWAVIEREFRNIDDGRFQNQERSSGCLGEFIRCL